MKDVGGKDLEPPFHRSGN